MGSVRLLYVVILLATSNAIFHVLLALLAAHNPVLTYDYLMNECAIGFSGVLFSMIVIETNLSGVQSRRLAVYVLLLCKKFTTVGKIQFNMLITFFFKIILQKPCFGNY